MDRATADLIRTRARHCCEYCKMPQIHDDLPFQFDHIIAQVHDGADAHENRAWACVPCNLHKGTNLSGVDPRTGNVVRLFDPRRQNWQRHFRWNGAVLEGKTQCGRATVRTLRINLPIRIAFRQSLIDIGEFPPSRAR
jgi:hypothetical protein